MGGVRLWLVEFEVLRATREIPTGGKHSGGMNCLPDAILHIQRHVRIMLNPVLEVPAVLEERPRIVLILDDVRMVRPRVCMRSMYRRTRRTP